LASCELQAVNRPNVDISEAVSSRVAIYRLTPLCAEELAQLPIQLVGLRRGYGVVRSLTRSDHTYLRQPQLFDIREPHRRGAAVTVHQEYRGSFWRATDMDTSGPVLASNIQRGDWERPSSQFGVVSGSEILARSAVWKRSLKALPPSVTGVLPTGSFGDSEVATI
jgi:hypothetical protein